MARRWEAGPAGRAGARSAGPACALLAATVLAGCGCGGGDVGADEARDVGPLDAAADVAGDPGPEAIPPDAPDSDVPHSDAPPSDLPPSDAPCTALFGVPNDRTGLAAGQCRPACDCEGRRFEPPAYTDADAAALAARVLLDPPAVPAEDPYLHPEAHVPVPGKVCAVQADGAVPGGYRLRTHDNVEKARAAGDVPTHADACGLCSSLQDLAVYMRQPDLTQPVRQCGIEGMVLGQEPHLECLRALGFSEPCTWIWYWNTLHTQTECQDLCLAQIDDPYHLPDGSLNTCLLCDEEKSGPVFKAVAGRTRRNTGLPSSMCRPCSEVVPFVHDYP